MAALFASGRIVDLILLLTVVEAAVLLAYHRHTGSGIRPSVLLPNLAAGAALLVALRAALTAAGWPLIAASLAAALVAHLADLALRWRRGAPEPLR